MTDVLVSGPLVLSMIAHDVRLDGRHVVMPNREFELLALLMQSPLRAFTRQHLYEAIWGEAALGELRTVDVHVSKLRHKLGAFWISTVRSVGYRFEPADAATACAHEFACVHCGTVRA